MILSTIFGNIPKNMPKTCKQKGCSYPVFGGGYCSRHQYLRLDKLIKPPRPKPSIKKFSNKTRKQVAQYMELRDIFLKDFPLCAANLIGCTKIATDIHHMQGRGINLLKTDTWIAVCRNCHNWIESHPREAKELNLSQSRLNK